MCLLQLIAKESNIIEVAMTYFRSLVKKSPYRMYTL